MTTENEDPQRIARALRILLDYILDGVTEEAQIKRTKDERDSTGN
jgi:hypothetical protein